MKTKKNLITLLYDLSNFGAGTMCITGLVNTINHYYQAQGILQNSLGVAISTGLSYWAIRSYKELYQSLKDSN